MSIVQWLDKWLLHSIIFSVDFSSHLIWLLLFLKKLEALQRGGTRLFGSGQRAFWQQPGGFFCSSQRAFWQRAEGFWKQPKNQTIHGVLAATKSSLAAAKYFPASFRGLNLHWLSQCKTCSALLRYRNTWSRNLVLNNLGERENQHGAGHSAVAAGDHVPQPAQVRPEKYAKISHFLRLQN